MTSWFAIRSNVTSSVREKRFKVGVEGADDGVSSSFVVIGGVDGVGGSGGEGGEGEEVVVGS